MSDMEKPKERISGSAKVILGFLAFVAVIAIHDNLRGPPKPPTPEQVELEAAQQSQREEELTRNSLAHTLYNSTRENLRNPDSMVIEKLYARATPPLVCLAYRAQNGFGGMVRDFIIYDEKTMSKDVKTWNKRCVESGMQDLTYMSKSMESSYERRH